MFHQSYFLIKYFKTETRDKEIFLSLLRFTKTLHYACAHAAFQNIQFE